MCFREWSSGEGHDRSGLVNETHFWEMEKEGIQKTYLGELSFGRRNFSIVTGKKDTGGVED